MFTIDMLTHLNDADLAKTADWLSYEVEKFRERYQQERDSEDLSQMRMHQSYLCQVWDVQEKRRRNVEEGN